jgi:hypothetical protein
VEALAAAVATHRPLGPADRDAEQQSARKYGIMNAPPPFCGRLAREAQEVAEADRRAGDREDDTERA